MKTSPLIQQLQEGSCSLDSFWKQVKERTTPLIDEGKLATFVWQGSPQHKNVVIASYCLASFDPYKTRLTHIPETDVWYASWVLPEDTRFIYAISPDDPLIRLADLAMGETFPSFTKTWEKDPLNPKKYPIPGSLSVDCQDLEMSILEMPGARHYPWKQSYSKGEAKRVHIPSRILETGRDATLYLPPGYLYNKPETPYPVVVIFDGYAFRDYMGLELFDYLIGKELTPPFIALMIDNPEPFALTRLRDLVCYDPFIEFVQKEALGWLSQNYPVTKNPQERVVAGMSLGGLSAAYMGLIHSKAFGNILAQSGPYWWNIKGEEDWLLHRFVDAPKLPLKLYLDAGHLETAPSFSNGLSILQSNRYLRDILKAKGYPLKYAEFHGWHDYISWQKTFVEGLQYLLDFNNTY